jgi:hypothetical protein
MRLKLPRLDARRAAGVAGVLARDVAGLCGCAATIYGISLIYLPAAWILGGAGTAGTMFWLSTQRPTRASRP